ncbi:MAG: hypothetical protein ONB05_03310 [candidate division KSB1 bacterium]|nr:hypothetical protein [candidate division KSB1 bacterium]
MKTNAPKMITFLIALIVAIIGVVAKLVAIPFLSAHTFLIMLIAFVILALANLIKGL